MIQSIVGKENYFKGVTLYFERHDGQAVTIEDFVKAMEEASGIDLSQFCRWYSQSGTPTVTIKKSPGDTLKFSYTKSQSRALIKS